MKQNVCQEFECNRTQIHILLTNFSFHATQKTKDKRVLSQNFSKPFCLLFFVDPLPRSAKGGFKGCGENPNSPRFLVLFRNRKRTTLFILRLLLLQCLLVQPSIILHQVLKLAHALHTLRHSKNQVLFPFRCL